MARIVSTMSSQLYCRKKNFKGRTVLEAKQSATWIRPLLPAREDGVREGAGTGAPLDTHHSHWSVEDQSPKDKSTVLPDFLVNNLG